MGLRDFQKTGKADQPSGKGRFGSSSKAAEPEKRASRNAPGSRFTGLRSREEGPLLLGEGEDDLGDHEVEVVSTSEKDSEKTGVPYVHAIVNLPDGEERKILFAMGGKGARQGKERLMAFVRGLAGFEDDDSFIEAIPNYHELIGAVCGERACEEAEGPNGKPFGENPLAGERVKVQVRRGNEKKDAKGNGTGEYYFEYVWSPL